MNVRHETSSVLDFGEVYVTGDKMDGSQNHYFLSLYRDDRSLIDQSWYTYIVPHYAAFSDLNLKVSVSKVFAQIVLLSPPFSSGDCHMTK